MIYQHEFWNSRTLTTIHVIVIVLYIWWTVNLRSLVSSFVVVVRSLPGRIRFSYGVYGRMLRVFIYSFVTVFYGCGSIYHVCSVLHDGLSMIYLSMGLLSETKKQI